MERQLGRPMRGPRRVEGVYLELRSFLGLYTQGRKVEFKGEGPDP